MIGVVASLVGANNLRAADLQPETLKAWESYVESADQSMKSRLIANHPFLWIDEDPRRRVQLIKKDEPQVAPDNGKTAVPVPNGLIHHWVGAVFIPHTTLDRVLSTTRDYDHYKDYFNPAVIQSEAVARSGDEDRFSILWAAKVLFISAGVDAQCLAHSVRVDDSRSYKVSVTTKVQEIQNYGQPDEHKVAPDQGNGFIWRLYTINRYEARDGGVVLEIETIALTRDIPSSIRLFVAPVVKRVSRNAMLLSLRQTRDAVSPGAQLARSHTAQQPGHAEVKEQSTHSDANILIRSLK